MRYRHIFPLLLMAFSSVLYAGSCPEYLNHELQKLHSTRTLNICEAYAGKTLLIVNTASNCGFTPQFKQLEKIHQLYKDKGLVVLGFSSNDFKQEASDEQDIATVCFKNYGVTFDMFSPITVTGSDTHPLFKALAAQSAQPAWNFNKYLLSRESKVIKYFDSQVKPDSPAITKAIDAALAP